MDITMMHNLIYVSHKWHNPYLIGSRFDLGGSWVVPSESVHIVISEAFKNSLQIRSSATIPRGSVPLGQPHTNVRLLLIPPAEMNRGSQKSVLLGSNSSNLIV